VAAAGDSAGLCANELAAIKAANRIVINGIDIFMAGFCQCRVTGGK
jgi:hypothetical protein